MNLYTNALIGIVRSDGQTETHRVLWIDPSRTDVVMIDIQDHRAMPRFHKYAELEVLHERGELRFLTHDPFHTLLVSDEELPEKWRLLRDRAWGVIKDLVADDTIFEEQGRGQRIKAHARRMRTTAKTIYTYLRRYWQAGQVKNGLLPRYGRCGAPGKERIAEDGHPKRGRPTVLSREDGQPRGVNMTPDRIEIVRRAYRRYYVNEGLSLRKAYERALATAFNDGWTMHDGARVPVIPEDRPSFSQFVYWAHTKRSNVERLGHLAKREGQRAYDLRHRSVIGDATQVASGPGALYQIDSTRFDHYLVHSLNRALGVGRPWLYVVVDVFSRLVTGFALTFIPPSKKAALLALDHAACDKVDFCKTYETTITPEEWPSQHIPEAIVADRAELVGAYGDHLVEALGIRVSNTPPYRPDWKSVVERVFRLTQDEIDDLPGAVRVSERGDPDYRLDACLTIQDARSILTQLFVHYNNYRRLSNYRLTKEMIADNVEPYAVDLWEWGVRNRSGRLRTWPQEIIRRNLLPRSMATVTAKGLAFRPPEGNTGTLYYASERALAEQWFAKARVEGSWKVRTAYNPFHAGEIYLCHDDGTLEPCRLVDSLAHFGSLDTRELIVLRETSIRRRSRRERDDLQAKANFIARTDAIVKRAKEQTEMALAGRGRESLVKHLRENAQDERYREERGASHQFAPDEPGMMQAPPPDVYVPPPRPVDDIRRAREKKWRRNE